MGNPTYEKFSNICVPIRYFLLVNDLSLAENVVPLPIRIGKIF